MHQAPDLDPQGHRQPGGAPPDRSHDLARDVVAGVAAGFVGTATMTVTLWAERRLRTSSSGPVDYDASPHVVTAAAAVIRWQPRTRWQRRLLFLAAHWGYGSAIGVTYVPLRRAARTDRAAAGLFYAGCQTMASTLFATVGGTPPPWRWRRDLLISSLAQHAVYAAAVSRTYARLASRAAPDRSPSGGSTGGPPGGSDARPL